MYNLQQHIYIYTLVLLLVTFSLIIILKREWYFSLKSNTKYFKNTFGSIMSLIGFLYILSNLIHLSYIHLMFGDLCMFMGVIIGPSLLFGNDKVIKVVLPWAFVGGLFTMIMSHPPFKEEGNIPALISYFKHVFLFIIGLIGITLYKYEKRDIINTFIFALSYAGFILMTSGIAYWSTGDEKYGAWSTSLLKPSYHEIRFESGSNSVVANDYEAMGDTNVPYPIPSLILFTFTTLFLLGSFKLSAYAQRTILSEENIKEESKV